MKIPSTHTKKEFDAISESFIHLRKDGKVIHKDPRAFEGRTMVVQEADPKTRDPRNVTKKIPPPCNLKHDYLDNGWVKCKIDGSDLPGPKKEAS